jgi:hypothetical protein
MNAEVDIKKNTSHACDQMKQAKFSGYGAAIDFIVFDKVLRCWEMGNSEYGAYPITNCPFCGLKLPEVK